MKKFLYLSACLLVTACISCTNTKESKSESNPVSPKQDQTEATADTVKAEKTDTIAKKDRNNGPTLTSTDAQLQYMSQSANSSRYNSGILPQLAKDAPEYCQKILAKGTGFLIVDKAKMKVFLYDKFGNIELSYPIACASKYGARQQAWDSRTPEGLLDVQGIYNSQSWRFVSRSGSKSGPGVFGPKFIRIAPSIGLHGTSSPGSIGKRISHGCIRLNNKNILELVNHVEVGMPVIVSPGPRDMLVNQSEGRNILAVVTEPGGTKAEPGNYQPKPAADPTVASTSKAKENKESSKSQNIQNKESRPSVTDDEDATVKPTENVAPAEEPKAEPKAEPKQEPKQEKPAEPSPAPAESVTAGI